MDLKELIKEVKLINDINPRTEYSIGKLKGIKQTVEAVDKVFRGMVTKGKDKDTYFRLFKDIDILGDWQKLKKLLGVK